MPPELKELEKTLLACDLFFTNILEILIEHMIGFDKKSKLPKEKGGIFGFPQDFVGVLKAKVKELYMFI